MPLLSFFQFGTIGKQGYTIAEVARQMYRSGYDLRHFIAASVPLAIGELIVRLGFMVKSSMRERHWPRHFPMQRRIHNFVASC